MQCDICKKEDKNWWLITMRQIGGQWCAYNLCVDCQLLIRGFIQIKQKEENAEQSNVPSQS